MLIFIISLISNNLRDLRDLCVTLAFRGASGVLGASGVPGVLLSAFSP